MKWQLLRAGVSTVFVAGATAMAVCGLFLIATFPDSYDEVGFYLSSGPPFFFWGTVLLTISYLLRLRLRLCGFFLVTVACIATKAWAGFRPDGKRFDGDFWLSVLLLSIVFLGLWALDKPMRKVYIAIRRMSLARMSGDD
jgi:hypothetical protein